MAAIARPLALGVFPVHVLLSSRCWPSPPSGSLSNPYTPSEKGLYRATFGKKPSWSGRSFANSTFGSVPVAEAEIESTNMHEDLPDSPVGAQKPSKAAEWTEGGFGRGDSNTPTNTKTTFRFLMLRGDVLCEYK